jgi:hypothetical protein
MKLLLLTALAGAAVAFGAAAQPLSEKSCFLATAIGDHTVGGPHTLYFKVKDRANMHALAFYRVEISGRCQAGMNSSTEHGGFAIGSIDRLGAAPPVCSRTDLRVTAGGLDCTVDSLTRMTSTEVAALPRGIRP